MIVQARKYVHSSSFRSLLILWGAIAVTILFVFFSFLFGDRLVVFNDYGSDTRQLYLMQHATIANHLRSGNLSLWDMGIGFGASIFALNPFNLFLIPVYLAGAVVGPGHIPTLLLYMMIAQFFLAGTFCYLFLSCFSLSEPGKVTASYIYAFCGYLLVWGQHYHFGTFVVLLPLLLCLLERAMQRRRFSPAASVLVAVMVSSSAYMSYMSLLMAGSWILFRAVLEDGPATARIRLFLARCGEILLGIGLGAVIFLPSVRFLTSVSSRLSSDSSFLERIAQFCSLFPGDFYRTSFLRFFSTTFEGIAQYRGYSNFYEAPVLFFSVLFVILLPQYIFSIYRQKTSRKSRAIQYLAVLLFIFCIFVRLGASIFNAFAYPFSRHSFIFMPLFALVTAWTLDEICVRRRISLPALAVSAVLLVAACVLAFHRIAEAESEKLKLSIMITGALGLMMILLLCLICFSGGSRKNVRRAASVLLFLCVAANVCDESWLCYNDRNTLTKSDATYWGTLYDPDVSAALAWLDENDPSLYRLEKDYYAGSFCMDGLAQGYRGISAYNATPNSNIEEFVNLVIPNLPIMARYEYTFRQIGYYTGHGSLFGIKYLLSREPGLELDGYSRIGQFGKIYLYQNENVSSFARFYTKAGDSEVLKHAYGKADLETMLLDVAMLDVRNADTGNDVSAVVRELTGGEAATADELLSGYALETIQELDSITADGTSYTVRIPIDREALRGYEHVYLEFDIETPQVSDFMVNDRDPMEYHFRTEAGKTKHVQLPVPSSCEEIELTRYANPFSGKVSGIRLLGGKRAPAQDSGAAITLGDTDNDSVLSGSVRTETGGFLFLPIPYEEGWSASVDGEETELLRTDIGFVSVPVTAGEHSFTFTYRQPWMREGLCVSVVSLIVWAALLILRRRRKH